MLKGEKRDFQSFKHEFLLKVNMLDISGHFIGQGTRVVLVGNPLKQKAVLLREGFSSEEIRGSYQAWKVIDGVLGYLTKKSIVRKAETVRWTNTLSSLELSIKYDTKSPGDAGPEGCFPYRLRSGSY